MPYEKGAHLPGESASKLGHLRVIQSEWVQELIGEFELKLSQSVNQNRCDKTDQKIRVLPLSGVRSDPRPNQNCRYFCENEAADRRRAGEHGVEVQNILFKPKKLRE